MKKKAPSKSSKSSKFSNTVPSRVGLFIVGGLLTLAMAVGLTAYAVANDATQDVTITSPTDGDVLERGEAINISAVVSPEINVASLVVSVDGEEICSGGGSDSISCEWKAPNRHEAHTITAVTTDTQDNIYTDAVTITVACALRTVNENAQSERAKAVTICQPTSPAADS